MKNGKYTLSNIAVPSDKEIADIIIKDGNGKEIPVKDNGDGTYTYEQKDGNVTIEVVFEAKKSDTPQTGYDSNLWLWLTLLFVSGTGICGIMHYDCKRKMTN